MLTTMRDRYFLGLPAWAFPGWKDRYFYDRPSRLNSYASVFNTVEGNTTFYRVPDPDSVRRWQTALAGSAFRFCFKLPREVTHEARPDRRQLDAFLAALTPLRHHLGPLFIQFPATVAPDDLPSFEPVFDAVRRVRRFVIEVRHPAFFDAPDALDSVVDHYAADRVIFDSRPLFRGDLEHPEVRAARHEKPDVAVVDRVRHGVTMVRLILHPDLKSNATYIDEWATTCAARLKAGGEVYMMIHCPNNLHCPTLAEQFHDALRQRLPDGALPTLPAWPVPQQTGLPGF
ncbi:MAG: DUF72 domain-containing protein [Gammaproteobacteria bacterium]